MQQQFFQFMGPNGAQINQNVPTGHEYIHYNEVILEICNNWKFVTKFMKSYNEGKINQADPLEHTWLQFLLTNNIDITLFQNKEDFEVKLWKTS